MLFLFIAVVFISGSCKKQELTSDNPMIGKWRALVFAIEDRCTTSPSSPSFYDLVEPLKKIEVEILKSGYFITTFEGEKEKLKFINMGLQHMHLDCLTMQEANSVQAVS